MTGGVKDRTFSKTDAFTMTSIHRITTNIVIDEMKHEIQDSLQFVLPEGDDVVHKRGISFFYFDDRLQLGDDQLLFRHTFRAFRSSACKLASTQCIDETNGLGWVQDKDITRMKNRNKFIACHVTLYPTIRMPFQEFKLKYESILKEVCHGRGNGSEGGEDGGKDGEGGNDGKDDGKGDGGGKDDGGENGDGKGDEGEDSEKKDGNERAESSSSNGGTETGHGDTSCTEVCGELTSIVFESDWLFDEIMTDCPMKDECAKVLFEYARNLRHPPDQCIRSLYFHYLLSEDGVTYSADVLKGDALSFYIARAFECCADAGYEDAEVRRDDIRLALEEVLKGDGYCPTLRSYPDTEEDEDDCSTSKRFCLETILT